MCPLDGHPDVVVRLTTERSPQKATSAFGPTLSRQMLHDRILPDGWVWDQGKLARAAMYDMGDDGTLRCYVYDDSLVIDKSSPGPRTAVMPLEVAMPVLEAHGLGPLSERKRILNRIREIEQTKGAALHNPGDMIRFLADELEESLK